MEKYHYQPLDNTETWIRILILEHGSGDDPLRATILHELLDEEPEYDAISYCWGCPEKPRTIILCQDGTDYSLPITESLYLALRRFRSPVEDRRLWTDAICINQFDEHEKGPQVRMMGRIYAQARKVLIYLGEPDRSTPKALRLMKKIHMSVVKSPNDDARPSMQWIQDNRLPGVEEPWKWEPLKMFFRLPWFRRKWIIQECVLAKQSVFHLGDWEEDWNYMAVVDKAINTQSLAVVDYTTYNKLNERSELQQGLTQLHNIAVLREALNQGIKYQLMDLVSFFQESEASNPRDHLFALLGLASDVNDPRLNPRYGDVNTVLSICLDYARFFLAQKGTLEVLYRAGLQGQELQAPSWIPDWYGGHNKIGCDRNNGLWDPLRRPTFYNVAPNTCPQFVDTTDPKVLGIKGTIIDSLTELANHHLTANSNTNLDKDLLLSQKRRHLEETDEIMSQLHGYPTGETLYDVQWRTLICNVTIDLHRAPAHYCVAYEAYRKFVLIHDDGGDIGIGTLDDFLTQQKFREVLDNFNGDKIFGVTGSGYVGMFPRSARVNDVIAVLDGGEFPFVLRRLGEGDCDCCEFELIGQCYVHGRMEEGQLDLRGPGLSRQNIFLGGFQGENA